MTPWRLLPRPVTDAELLGQGSALLLGAALCLWAVVAVCDLLEREL